jgi:hypothetical protein
VLGIAMVVAVDASMRWQGPPVALVFVAYSVAIWAIIPAAAALGITAVAALTTSAELPRWLTLALVGLTTAAWLSWAVGSPGGLVYGLVVGAGGAGAGAVLGAGGPLPLRVVAALAVVAVTAMALVLVLS